jgi:hypothetical protein
METITKNIKTIVQIQFQFMKISLFILAMCALILLVLAISFGISYLAYWIVLSAGAPKYVAVIVGVAVFCISGNIKSK